jgi:hypothetical protein
MPRLLPIEHAGRRRLDTANRSTPPNATDDLNAGLATLAAVTVPAHLPTRVRDATLHGLLSAALDETATDHTLPPLLRARNREELAGTAQISH